MQDCYGVIRNAPYGNTLSDVERVKIVGGRPVAIKEEDRWSQKVLASVQAPMETQAVCTTNPMSRFNRHPVIPPISTETYQDKSEELQLSRRDELNLRNRVADGLSDNFDSKRLKEAYCELSSIDTHLSRFTDYSSLSYALARSKIDISLNDLHQMSAMFTNPRDGRQVAYEKVLSFIAASHAIHKRTTTTTDTTPAPSKKDKTGRVTIIDDVNSHQQTPRFTPQHNTRSLLSSAMSNTQEETNRSVANRQLTLNNDIIRIFLQADINNTNVMTPEQIRTLTYASGLQVKEDDINDALRISILNSDNQTHNWKVYLETVRNLPKRESPMRQIEVKRKTLSAAEEETIKRDEWFKRFMKMAKALYSNDSENAGILSLKQTTWLVKEYNDIYSLSMEWNQLRDILERLTFANNDGTQVLRIDQLLRALLRLVH